MWSTHHAYRGDPRRRGRLAMSGPLLDPRTAPAFPKAAHNLLRDMQLRKNLHHATSVIQNKRARVVAELGDWEQLRLAGQRIREHTMAHLDAYLEQFEQNCTRAGGIVHWARDAEEARQIVVRLAKEAIANEQRIAPSPAEIL